MANSNVDKENSDFNGLKSPGQNSKSVERPLISIGASVLQNTRPPAVPIGTQNRPSAQVNNDLQGAADVLANIQLNAQGQAIVAKSPQLLDDSLNQGRKPGTVMSPSGLEGHQVPPRDDPNSSFNAPVLDVRTHPSLTNYNKFTADFVTAVSGELLKYTSNELLEHLASIVPILAACRKQWNAEEIKALCIANHYDTSSFRIKLSDMLAEEGVASGQVNTGFVVFILSKLFHECKGITAARRAAWHMNSPPLPGLLHSSLQPIHGGGSTALPPNHGGGGAAAAQRNHAPERRGKILFRFGSDRRSTLFPTQRGRQLSGKCGNTLFWRSIRPQLLPYCR
jgi:hypothetical protein